jgi:hypothetical protein
MAPKGRRHRAKIEIREALRRHREVRDPYLEKLKISQRPEAIDRGSHRWGRGRRQLERDLRPLNLGGYRAPPGVDDKMRWVVEVLDCGARGAAGGVGAKRRLAAVGVSVIEANLPPRRCEQGNHPVGADTEPAIANASDKR